MIMRLMSCTYSVSVLFCLVFSSTANFIQLA